MAIIKPIYGHNSFETAYLVASYPYGRLRCKMWFWLETKDKKGVRFVSQSENPKNGRMNKPHASTYSLIAGNMYLDENEHVQWSAVTEYSSAEEVLKFIELFPQNHCMEKLFVWCKMKCAYANKAVETGRTQFGELSEADIVRYTTERNIWQEAFKLAEMLKAPK